jgi:predicted glycoside hydrolase/deacetylase ChbG (UPF0249 family)
MTHTAPRGTRQLIVNADDHGLTPAVSAGIRQAHYEGIVTSTTTLMCRPSAADDLARLRAECPGIAAGVHLCVTEFRPLSPPAEVPTLVTADGTFRGFDEFRVSFDAIDLGELRRELVRQLEAFERIMGPPSHLDSHHHALVLHPPFAGVLLEIAATRGVPVRYFVRPPERPRCPLLSPASEAAIAALVERHGTPHADYFEYGFYGDGVSLARLLELARDLPPGVSELMCHPGLPGTDEGYAGRSHEREILCDAALKPALADAGIELVAYHADPSVTRPARGREG